MNQQDRLSHILKLQNGSDVRGVAVEGIIGENRTLLPEYVNSIAQAFTLFIARTAKKDISEVKIAIGHDSRVSADELSEQAIAGIIAQGAQAVDCGLATTPAMFMSLIYEETAYDGSIMLTASHLPFNRNGMKFFEPQGGALEKSVLRSILEEAATLAPAPVVQTSSFEKYNITSLYACKLVDIIRREINSALNYGQPLLGTHIVVDAGNGAGGFFADKVLQPLGVDTTGSVYLNPDGYFPNHIPNPEDKVAMQSIQRAVLTNKADLGLIFDTDVDRMSAVLSSGKEINRNNLIALMASILAPTYPHSTIVTDSVTSNHLTRFLEEDLGLKHHRFQRGYKNVINECKRLNEAGIESPLAIETSGHGALKENYYLDDGAYMAVKLLVAVARARANEQNLEDLIQNLQPIVEEGEYRLQLLGDNFKEYGQMVLKEFEERARERGLTIVEPNYEGVRIKFTGDIQGWALLRQSLHDPNMPLNIEGERAGDLLKIKDIMKKLLTGYEDLDIRALNK